MVNSPWREFRCCSRHCPACWRHTPGAGLLFHPPLPPSHFKVPCWFFPLLPQGVILNPPTASLQVRWVRNPPVQTGLGQRGLALWGLAPVQGQILCRFCCCITATLRTADAKVKVTGPRSPASQWSSEERTQRQVSDRSYSCGTGLLRGWGGLHPGRFSRCG